MQFPTFHSRCACIALSLFIAGESSLFAQSKQITVSAGEWDRAQSVVSFAAPGTGKTAWQLRDERGRVIPVQTDAGGRASFILERLPKGATATFQLSEASSAGTNSSGGVQVSRAGTKIKATVGGKTVLEYQAEPGELPPGNIRPIFQRGGYIHPVVSPSGLVVTDDYPSDHRHHHGIWFPWTRTEFEGRNPDFWNMGQGSARVDFVALDEFWSGPVFGGLRARHEFVVTTNSERKRALDETWEVRVYAVSDAARPYWMFDLVSTQNCASASPLTLLKYHYGGLGLRGAVSWKGATNAFFLTSEGITNRNEGNETRARWCHMGGWVNGQLTGIAVFDHPENFRAPQPLRLNPTDPFVCYSPPQLGDFKIEPGKPYVSRYRFVVMDGPPDRAELDRLWNDYAHPPQATVK